jgi:hypothetical protein
LTATVRRAVTQALHALVAIVGFYSIVQRRHADHLGYGDLAPETDAGKLFTAV